MKATEFVVRQVTDMAGAVQIEQVQKLAWGMTDVEVIPSRFMHALEHNGACLLGAYHGERMVGFSFGLVGFSATIAPEVVDQAGPLHMYSAISGIIPDYQASGVGYLLKTTQREIALGRGIRLITWTYDPLESRNGYFNVNKLGVVCGRYLRDFHGQMGGINAGLSTDRFYVEWWLESDRVTSLSAGQMPLNTRERLLAEGAVIVNESEKREGSLPAPPAAFETSQARLVLAEIPADFQRLKKHDMKLAIEWRSHTRQLFEHYFENGYQVKGFVRYTEDEVFNRSYYVLEKITV